MTDEKPRLEPSQRLRDAFPVCPECHALWRLHWVYVQGADLIRRWNTCALMPCEIETKWLPASPARPA